jgi:hypothetical protein
MKKLTLLLIVGLCLAVSGLADVVLTPDVGDRSDSGFAGNKAPKKRPLLRKAPPKLKPSPLLRKAVPPRNERGGNHNSSRSNTSRRAPQKGSNPDNGRAETQYPNKQKYRLDLARPARKGNARNERGGDYHSTRSNTSSRLTKDDINENLNRIDQLAKMMGFQKSTPASCADWSCDDWCRFGEAVKKITQLSAAAEK